MTENIFSKTLGIVSPWRLDKISISDPESRVDMYVTFSHDSEMICSECGSTMGVSGFNKQLWKHADFFSKTAYIHADMPEIRCCGCHCELGVSPPWTRAGSKFARISDKENNYD